MSAGDRNSSSSSSSALSVSPRSPTSSPTFGDQKHEGFLWKFSVGKSIIFGSKNWKERWFMARNDGLCYYEKPPTKGAKPKCHITWNEVTYIHTSCWTDTHAAATDPTHCYFAVRFLDKKTERILLLRAPDHVTRRAWVDEFAKRVPTMVGEMLLRELRETELEEEDGGDKVHHTRKTRAAAKAPAEDSLERKDTMYVVKGIVSKNKLRFQNNGFDLDLSYITPQIIAMGFPSSGAESLYRNSLEDVEQFISFYHKGKCKVYNLCCERSYSKDKFGGSFAHFPFEDHNPPPARMLKPCLDDIKAWLQEDTTRVAAIHCKAGKGRTGTIIAAYLLYTNQCSTAEEALTTFGKQRTKDGHGVTIPSQKRYVGYFAQIMQEFGGECPPDSTVELTGFILNTTPHFDLDGGCDPYYVIYGRETSRDGYPTGKKVKLYDSRQASPAKHYTNSPHVALALKIPVKLTGDVKICFYDEDIFVDDSMFHFWINTSFLDPSGETTLKKGELDGANKDKSCSEFDADFSITLKYKWTNGPPERKFIEETEAAAPYVTDNLFSVERKEKDSLEAPVK